MKTAGGFLHAADSQVRRQGQGTLGGDPTRAEAQRTRNMVLPGDECFPIASTAVPLVTWDPHHTHNANGRPESKEGRNRGAKGLCWVYLKL